MKLWLRHQSVWEREIEWSKNVGDGNWAFPFTRPKVMFSSAYQIPYWHLSIITQWRLYLSDLVGASHSRTASLILQLICPSLCFDCAIKSNINIIKNIQCDTRCSCCLIRAFEPVSVFECERVSEPPATTVPGPTKIRFIVRLICNFPLSVFSVSNEWHKF